MRAPREPGGFLHARMRYNPPAVQRNPASVDDAEASAERAVEPTPASRGVPGAATRVGAGTDWHGSSFDLAQGLDVKVMESKLSREMLDALFRS
jgi:hypothetical protein